MREIIRTTYSAIRPDFSSRLILDHEAEQSAEACKKHVDLCNSRAVRRGFTAQQYLICEEEMSRKFDDNGMFAEECKKTRAIELYPKDLKKCFLILEKST